ncbi:MAG: precorrin-4 C(11)-methyltransferase [Leptospiraceae bacterium]|jgi:precorrin-4/cobalt-precorrin-4 C11-methyltransferase|nr:precorrin-4 C(11)-methyltransferase [Leptospiraceae bacterium]
MKVYFIGAGPGDPELLTLKAIRIIEKCPVILYTGSLVPQEVFQLYAQKNALVYDTSSMTLEEIIEKILDAQKNNYDVARIHTGDPTIYGAIAEQIRELEKHQIDYEIIPGISSFTAAACALKKELTIPELTQTIIITRMEGRTPMPEKEKLMDLAKHESSLVLFLSINLLPKIVDELLPILGESFPIAIVYKASTKEESVIIGNLGNIVEKWRNSHIRSQSIIIISKVLEIKDFANSKLYDKEFFHKFRKKLR